MMSRHLGLHWNMLLAMARKSLKANKLRTWVLFFMLDYLAEMGVFVLAGYALAWGMRKMAR